MLLNDTSTTFFGGRFSTDHDDGGDCAEEDGADCPDDAEEDYVGHTEHGG